MHRKWYTKALFLTPLTKKKKSRLLITFCFHMYIHCSELGSCITIPFKNLFTPSTDFCLVLWALINTTAEHVRSRKQFSDGPRCQRIAPCGNTRFTKETLCFSWCAGQNGRKTHQFGLTTSNSAWQTWERLLLITNDYQYEVCCAVCVCTLHVLSYYFAMFRKFLGVRNSDERYLVEFHTQVVKSWRCASPTN